MRVSIDRFQTANEKFQVGDALTDKELLMLLAEYSDMRDGMEALGSDFSLALYELNRRFFRLQGYARSRSLRGF